MRLWSFFAVTLAALALLAGGPARAQLQRPGGPAIATSLLAEQSHAAPGETLRLAILMQPKPGWHGYWQNPGDAGSEMRIGWSLPSGVVAGRPRYPVPQTLMISGLMNHVYNSDYALLVDMKLPASLPAGTLPIQRRM